MTPPAKFVQDEDGREGTADSSLVSGGCIISGGQVRRSLLSTGTRMYSNARVEDCVVLPYVELGRHSHLSRAIVDRGVRIPDDLVIGEDPEQDAARFRRTEGGVTLVTQPMIDRLAL